MVNNAYGEYFTTSPDVLTVKLKDFEKYANTKNRYTVLVNNYKVKSINTDMINNIVEYELHQVK